MFINKTFFQVLLSFIKSTKKQKIIFCQVSFILQYCGLLNFNCIYFKVSNTIIKTQQSLRVFYKYDVLLSEIILKN